MKACDQSLLVSQEARFNAYLSNNLQSENPKSVCDVAEAMWYQSLIQEQLPQFLTYH